MKSHVRAIILLSVFALLVGCLGSVGAKHTEITAQEVNTMLKRNDDAVVLDVRERSEYCSKDGHIPGAINYPWNSGVLQKRYPEIGVTDTILIVCRSGRRSHEAADYLKGKGFSNIYDVTGGMDAWEWKTTGCDDSDTHQGE
jgi:rhodanese-related sulfurtransferase